LGRVSAEGTDEGALFLKHRDDFVTGEFLYADSSWYAYGCHARSVAIPLVVTDLPEAIATGSEIARPVEPRLTDSGSRFRSELNNLILAYRTYG